MSTNTSTTVVKTVTIHGEPDSVAVKRVLVVLAELGVPFALKFVSWADPKIKSEEYKSKMNPFGLIPVMDDKGFVLYESRAIAKYLVAKYDPKNTHGLMPTEPADVEGLQACALFDQAVSVEVNNFESHALRICHERVFKPLQGFQGSEEIARAEIASLEKKLEAYEIILGKQKYLAGDTLTLADLFHLPLGHLLTMELGLDILTGPKDGGAGENAGKLPNVARWWKDISSRKAWRDVLDQADKTVKDIA